jgi:hypothetical protein
MSASLRKITPQTARRMAISAQRLSGAPGDMMETIRALGCLQLDPTSAVARSHQLVLWSRLGVYSQAEFDRLMWVERRLFEYWAHAASIVLTENYPIHAAQMRSSHSGDSAWVVRFGAWLHENESLRQHVLRELSERGPLQLSEIGGKDKVGMNWVSGGWTTERTAARMVDYLWARGDVLVHGRRGQNRLWHLAEHVLPAWTPREALDAPAVTRRAAQISLRALGVGTEAHIRSHFVRGHYPHLKQVLKELEAEGRIQQVEVGEGSTRWPGVWYLHHDDVAQADRLEAGAWMPRTTLLSPFDNLICDRKRTQLMWDFDFRLEIYTPKHKRKYGYFVMPILHGDRLIGRIDPQMDRKAQRLHVHAVHMEPNAPLDKDSRRALRASIEALADWLGARDLVTPSA